MLLDGGLESSGVGTNNGSDLLAVLEEDESGHGANAELLGDLGDLVDVDLVEAGAGVGRGHLDDLRGDGLAGTAPGGEEVDDHQGAGLSASGIEVGLSLEVVDTGRSH